MQCFNKAPRKKGTRWKEKVKKSAQLLPPSVTAFFYEARFSRIGFDFPQKKKMQQRQKNLYPIGAGGEFEWHLNHPGGRGGEPRDEVLTSGKKNPRQFEKKKTSTAFSRIIFCREKKNK